MVWANSCCLGVRLPLGVFREHSREDQQAVERVRSSCDMLARNSDLYFGRPLELLGLLLEGQLGELDLAVLALDLRLLRRKLARLGLKLFVVPLQLVLPVLQQLFRRLQRRGLFLEPGVGFL